MVERDGVGYRASVDPTQVDAVDFERRVRAARTAGAEAAAGQEYSPALLGMFDEAIALWRGEPLSDFATEHWAIAEAARLTELRLAAVTERAQVALALGRHREVAADLEPVVAEDPTLESVAGLLMVALYRSGRQADALEVYTRTRDLLDESLGLEPSVSLRSLHERVLRQDESLGAQPEMAPLATVPVPSPRARASADPGGATNLPTVLRPLIGRDAELDSLAGLVGQVRLLTLIGPGGAGKTSLALAAVARTAQEFPDGAFGVRLASVNAPDQVPVAVADALGVPLDGAAGANDIRERLIAYLGRKQLLVLVDNCEHVVDAAATLIEDILASCPQVTVLATSREALAIPDEVQVTVGPLDAPPEGTAARPGPGVPGRAAVRRACPGGSPRHACTANPTWPPSDASAAPWTASRSRSSSPPPGRRRCRRWRSPTVSRTGSRCSPPAPGPPRPGSRRCEPPSTGATTCWPSPNSGCSTGSRCSRRLEPHRRRGGRRRREHAARRGARHHRPAGRTVDAGGRARARPPGTGCWRRCASTPPNSSPPAGEAETLARRHAEYFRDVALEAEMGLRGHGQRAGLARLREDQPNLRAALAWLGGAGGDLDSALAMAGALGLFWHLGRHLEGRELLARLLATGTGSPAARASALQAVSLVERPRACLVHPSPRCAETAAESLELFEQLGDPSRAALSRVLLAVQGVTGADPERSEELLREAEDQFMTDAGAGTDADVWGAGVIGFVRMETALKTGDEASAIPIGRAAAARFRQPRRPVGALGDPVPPRDGACGSSAATPKPPGCSRRRSTSPPAPACTTPCSGRWPTSASPSSTSATKRRRATCSTVRPPPPQQVGDGAGEVLSGYGYGLLAQVHEDWAEARARFTEAEPGFGKLATPVPEGLAIAGLARCDEADGDLDTARAEYERALEMGRRVGEPGLVATALEGLARLATQRGGDDARELLAEAADVRRRGARPAPPHERRDLERAGLLAD